VVEMARAVIRRGSTDAALAGYATEMAGMERRLRRSPAAERPGNVPHPGAD
jgi:hypothetical protein